MNQQDKQAIDELFQYLYRTAQQAATAETVAVTSAAATSYRVGLAAALRPRWSPGVHR
jgi:hypothetical protein